MCYNETEDEPQKAQLKEVGKMKKTQRVPEAREQVYISARQLVGQAVIGRGEELRIYEGVSLASYQRLAWLVEQAGAEVMPSGLGWSAFLPAGKD